MPSSSFAPRAADIHRTTGETDVTVHIGLDPDSGTPDYECDTGVGFFDHMLDLFARHGGFDLAVRCDGDLPTGDHHTVEDVGIAMGRALNEALGDKAYVARYGHAYVPMDEALARAVVDLSGRFYLSFDAAFSRDRVGDFATEMTRHFWRSLAEQAQLTLHLDLIRGQNAHHQVEALFKAGSRALRAAVARHAGGDRTPSTKGVL